MERQISKALFKAKACELFRQVETLGGSVVVTDHGKPTIEIRRYTAGHTNPLDVLRSGIASFDPEPAPDCTARSARDR
ncbi:type II toxin-antitoxin system Phd/YefM family antitoxin [Paraburkholderia youngii]|uniref:type II toxin-antitoxin system Phd/YefM family antitoxin n=1 Tax=Paraburkholderia youngii TaxID=2782701 RepID=UPI003D22EABC